jgi:hypothetical protein
MHHFNVVAENLVHDFHTERIATKSVSMKTSLPTTRDDSCVWRSAPESLRPSSYHGQFLLSRASRVVQTEAVGLSLFSLLHSPV